MHLPDPSRLNRLRIEAPLHYRAAAPSDTDACIELRGQTRENAFSVAALGAVGITAASWRAGIEQGRALGHVGLHDERLVGYCFGDASTGEILVLAVLPEFEGRGIAKRVLRDTVRDLQARGHARLFLACSADRRHRSHGFYRRMGWASTDTFDANRDEILEYVVDEARPPPTTAVKAVR